jgi:hypothetical protein
VIGLSSWRLRGKLLQRQHRVPRRHLFDNVHVREYDAAGNPVDGDRLVNDPASDHY